MKNLILCLVMLLEMIIVFGQDIYTGKVVDSKKQPTFYVNVVSNFNLSIVNKIK